MPQHRLVVHYIAMTTPLRLLPLLLLPAFLQAADDTKTSPTLPERPIVAVFPIGGDAKESARDRAALAFRAKLDRTDKFTVIDGPKMKELAAEAKEPVTFDTPVDVIKQLADTEKPNIFLWGDLKGTTLRVNVLDLRETDPKPHALSRAINDPTDMRFATEQILETIQNVDKFAHPNEIAVQHDAKAEELWKKNPNLMINGDFAEAGHWSGILESQYYPIEIGQQMPGVDKVAIVKVPAGPDGKPGNVLVMHMSKGVAETNGLACLSDPIEIATQMRYRMSFKYNSDGPTLHIFVKGYTKGKDIKGQPTLREIYRRQVPPTGSTHGKWVEIVDEMNPQHVSFPVQVLKVDLYIYLGQGTVMFDDIVLKSVGEPTRDAKDKAIKPPGERPKGAKD